MKINYETYPILKKLEDGKIGRIPMITEDMVAFMQYQNVLDKITESFKVNCSHFKDITFVSNSFMEAAAFSSEKLGLLYKDIVENSIDDININGTFIQGDIVLFFKHVVRKDADFEDTCVFCFHKDGMPLFFYERNPIDGGSIGWASHYYGKQLYNEGAEFIYMGAAAKLVIISLFKSYAQVETKYIAPNSKILNGKTKHQNDTNLGVTYLTSKWFTNIVRSEGFVVRGHFRLQPKKVNGEWTKELIYIESFEKTGYTHNAQINA